MCAQLKGQQKLQQITPDDAQQLLKFGQQSDE